MNLHALLLAREAAGNPLRVGLIGAGKFGSMFLSQALRTRGLRVTRIADLSPARARDALLRVGWHEDRLPAIGEDAKAMIASDDVDIVIDATGSPAAGIGHVLACCTHGKHVVMVNVEADALAGPLLARRAREAGIVYSLAYGDQPALICEMVDWARCAGFDVVAAGKGTKYLPQYHASTPDTVWNHYGLSREQANAGGMNAQMFNSFLDGTKSAIEMAAVANATGLACPADGLAFPACGVDDIARLLRPAEAGGTLATRGQVEVISSLERDGRPVFRDLRWGVYVCFEGGTDYVRRCFAEYGLNTDPDGRFTAMYKPFHLIGLELGISVASVGLRREPTGAATGWVGDVVATAKRDLAAGEVLDGEGGYRVYGKLMPAARSVAIGGLPLGLAHGVTLTRAVSAGTALRYDDVAFPAGDATLAFRREMEAAFGAKAATVATATGAA
ncbi:MAG: NAD(P)H-dependent oxidoreductase [Lautropia sp.]